MFVSRVCKRSTPLIAENGVNWMYANCSTTAQRGSGDEADLRAFET